ncbi:MAG: 3'-phosphoadenosine 5'-phosphosulfate sulfotransferase (PAPS reductase)/FAD synthetase [Myxococcota bacterium]|jgi:3'-phosphoadenosine 5'-phosphosulfate sulfotransferase (PAPS reductase)/FAD synthetase
MARQFGPIPDLDAWRDRALEEIDGRQVVCSISGGKDSTAMALLLREVDIPFISVHLDTGWEHPATDRYVREYLPTIIGHISITRREKGGMADLVRQQAGFPGGNQRFCTRELKIIPMRNFMRTLDEEPINTIGIRSGESRRRAEMPEWDYSDTMKCAVWRPIKPFTEKDVYQMHKRHNVDMNPLYGAGAARVGCWPCVFSRKSEIRRMADIDPGRIDIIRNLEQEVSKMRDKRNENRGRESGCPPTWFAHKMASWTIDEVVAWACSDLGSTQWRNEFEQTDEALDVKARIAQFQPELFTAPAHERGCMRWGLCETSSDEDEAEDPINQI